MHLLDMSLTSIDSEAATRLADEAVIERIRQGDTEAYEIIMRRYNQRLYRAARSILQDEDTAQDAVQEAYISAFYKLDSYKPGGSFAAWLTRITVNEALMIKRNPDTRVAGRSDNMSNDTLNASHTNPSELLSNKELASLIESAIDVLPDNFRSVFVLRAIQQLNVQETAVSLDIPEATVKTRYHRARKLMQAKLDQDIQAASLQVYEFAGRRCDQIVQTVLTRLRK